MLISEEFDETMSVEELVKKSKDIEDRIEAINGNLCDIPEAQEAPGRLTKRRLDLLSILSSLRKRIKGRNALKQPEHSTKDEKDHDQDDECDAATGTENLLISDTISSESPGAAIHGTVGNDSIDGGGMTSTKADGPNGMVAHIMTVNDSSTGSTVAIAEDDVTVGEEGNSDSIDVNRGDPGSLDNIEYDVDEKIQHAEENIEPLNEIERKSPAASVPDSTVASSPTAGDGTEYSTALDTNLCCNCSEELEMSDGRCNVCLNGCHFFCAHVSGVSENGLVKRECYQCRPENRIPPPFKVPRQSQLPDMFMGEILWKYVKGLACNDRDPLESDQRITSIGFVAASQLEASPKPVRIFWISDREPTMWQVTEFTRKYFCVNLKWLIYSMLRLNQSTVSLISNALHLVSTCSRRLKATSFLINRLLSLLLHSPVLQQHPKRTKSVK